MYCVSYRDWLKLSCSKFGLYTFSEAINKNVPVRMRRLVCDFDVRTQQNQVFALRGTILLLGLQDIVICAVNSLYLSTLRHNATYVSGLPDIEIRAVNSMYLSLIRHNYTVRFARYCDPCSELNVSIVTGKALSPIYLH